MSNKNNNFFQEKKSWSEVKDELLGCYLKPYMQKVLNTRKPIVYVDCFAGKGRFEDGNPGSPIIALEIIKDCLSRTQIKDCIVQPYFIDLNHAKELSKNIEYYEVPNNNIISGRYEDNIYNILSKNEGSNLFLYIDPYGIKALNHKLFDEFASSKKFNSVELLINLNSFGFIREGCRVLGVNFGDETLFGDLIEYETTKLDKNESSVKLLNEIAGGVYWQEIIQRKNRGEIDTKESEVIFANQYCNRLKQNYRYVLNMPLRIKSGHAPKYRMVHATNNIEGCLLMVNNICNRWQLMKDIQSGGQMSLFTENYDNDIIDEMELKSLIVSHMQNYQQLERLNGILAEFFLRKGPICTTGNINDILRILEDSGEIEVYREPKYTPTGRESRFFADEKGKITRLRWRA